MNRLKKESLIEFFSAIHYRLGQIVLAGISLLGFAGSWYLFEQWMNSVQDDGTSNDDFAMRAIIAGIAGLVALMIYMGRKSSRAKGRPESD